MSIKELREQEVTDTEAVFYALGNIVGDKKIIKKGLLILKREFKQNTKKE